MADKKKSSWQTVEEYQTEKLNKRTADAIKESKKITKEKKDSYTERNEFKPGFYDQPSKPPITPETYYGTASGKTMFEPDIVDPDTSMMMNRKKGGVTKGQKKIGKVMKEFKEGKLHSGKKGPVVKNPKQAIAIALSEAGMSKPKKMFDGGEIELTKGKDYIKDLL